MKILHVIPTYVPTWRYGGPIRAVHELCKSIVKLGEETHVFTTSVDGASDLDVPILKPIDTDGVKIWYFPSKYIRRIYYSAPMKRTLKLRIRDFDLLHLHSVFLWPTWMAARMAFLAKKPYILSPRGMLVRSLIQKKNRYIKLLWINSIEKQNLERASAIHVTSQIEKEELIALGLKIKYPKIIVIPNGVESEPPKRGDSAVVSSMVTCVEKLTPMVLFLGRLNWKKGLDKLIPAIANVPNCHLVIAGNDEEGYQRQLERWICEKRIGDRVHFIGFINYAEKALLFKRACVLVLPSYSENFGNVVLEAMASGCPVIITPQVGLADVVFSYGAGLVVDNNGEALTEAIARLVNDDSLRSQMGRSGMRAVADKFSWASIAQTMRESYRRILKVR